MQTLRAALVVVCGLVLAGSVAWAAAQQKPASGPAAKEGGGAKVARVGEAAPDFALPDSRGTNHKLSDYKDKVVVLEWLNQECPWSRKAVPILLKLHKKYATRGVVWLGIESTHGRKPADNETYARDMKLPYPILMDSEGKVGRAYGAKTTPHIFVIRTGRLVYQGGLHNDQYGKRSETEFRNYVDEALEAVLAGKKVPLAETIPWGCSVKYKKQK